MEYSIRQAKNKIKKGEKSKMETTRNYQVDNVEQQQQQQELFDLETKRKIQDSLQEIYNKQQKQQATNGGGRKGKFIKFVHDGENKRLSLTGQFQKEQVYHTRTL